MTKKTKIEAQMALHISDQAEEFRIELHGRFADGLVGDAATAWKAALHQNNPRRISVDITQMTGYDPAGFVLLREMHSHGTHIVAGTPGSLLFFDRISSPLRPLSSTIPEEKPIRNKRNFSKKVVTMPLRSAAAGS